jgi:hypothetical protein
MTYKRAALIAGAVLLMALMACIPTSEDVVTPTPTAAVPTPPVGAATPKETAVAIQGKPVGTVAPAEKPAEVGLSPDQIMSRSVETMAGAISAHIVFEQEVVGGYTTSGEGVVVLPDRAHFQKISSFDEKPVETIVIGATGYWVDESVSGGWNGGPIAPFASNPARWIELLQFYEKPALLGEEKVNGVECYHLQFAVTFEPGWLGLFSGGGTGEAWVSTEGFSLVKAIYDVEYEGTRESDSMNLTLELSHLNEPVAIKAPR